MIPTDETYRGGHAAGGEALWMDTCRVCVSECKDKGRPVRVKRIEPDANATVFTIHYCTPSHDRPVESTRPPSPITTALGAVGVCGKGRARGPRMIESNHQRSPQLTYLGRGRHRGAQQPARGVDEHRWRGACMVWCWARGSVNQPASLSVGVCMPAAAAASVVLACFFVLPSW